MAAKPELFNPFVAVGSAESDRLHPLTFVAPRRSFASIAVCVSAPRHMPPSAALTLDQIAGRAKVCKSTVSLALRHSRKIRSETGDRIRAIAREMGYRPNPLVAAHMAHLRGLYPLKTGQCIAFLCNRELADLHTETRTPLRLYYNGALARARELGYELELFNLFAVGMTGRRMSQILKSRGIIGVVIAPLSEGKGRSDVELDWDDFALATIEHTLLEPRLHTVCNDEFSTIGRLVQRLLDAGFQRIGIAMPAQMDDHANHHWLAGYQTFQALTAARYRVPHLITDAWSPRTLLRWYERWRPEAVIGIGSDVVRWLREAGLKVPGDVSCTTLYWQEQRAYLSGFYQNHELMAAGAVDLVVGQLNLNERGIPASHKTTLVQAEWKDGATLRPRVRVVEEAPLRVWKR